MATIFSKIIKGEIPCHKILEDDNFIAFLDISPVAKGHTLVVSKREIDYFFDLDEEELSAIMIFSKKLAIALKKVIPCLKIGVSVIGLEVPHVHVHLVPINSVADMTFGKHIPISSEELTSFADQIRSFL